MGRLSVPFHFCDIPFNPGFNQTQKMINYMSKFLSVPERL